VEIQDRVEEEYQSLTDLNSFLKLYYRNMNVLQTRADFFDLAHDYIQRYKRAFPQ
jgi:adenosine deaminase